ncbi:MAG: acyl-CoA dehydratase activase [bacterium]|nr:acyl-CoA dehydratase activase [bacterium]
MYTCGIDIGSRTTKIIILDDDDQVQSRGRQQTGGRPLEIVKNTLENILVAARLKRDDLAAIASTGYGRKLIPDTDYQFTGVTCHAAGAYHAFPGTRNVLDIGALRSTAIRLYENGKVHRFRLNDRCGAGIGRFLERVAETLEIPLEELGQLALFSKNPQPIPNVCAVIAETEVLNHITREEPPADIIRGVCEALAERLAMLLREVWIPDAETTLTGGVGKNAGMVHALEDVLKTPINIHHDSEFMGAIGAAILAKEILQKKLKKSLASVP